MDGLLKGRGNERQGWKRRNFTVGEKGKVRNKQTGKLPGHLGRDVMEGGWKEGYRVEEVEELCQDKSL